MTTSLKDEINEAQAFTLPLMDFVAANTGGPGIALAALMAVAGSIMVSIVQAGHLSAEEMRGYMRETIDDALAKVKT
jgi:hypothetical protein